jgi:DNA mismatch repair protein MutS
VEQLAPQRTARSLNRIRWPDHADNVSLLLSGIARLPAFRAEVTMSLPPASYQLFVGIDIAAASASVACATDPRTVEVAFTITQTSTGFADLQTRLARRGIPREQILVVLEATNTYWMSLALLLHDAGYAVSVINPAQAHQFARALLKRAKSARSPLRRLTAVLLSTRHIPHNGILRPYLCRLGRGNGAMVTPARRQYLDLKAQHPDAILWFRMGDFYEMFDEDARTAAQALHITLTGRTFGKDGRVPMAGIPYHAANSYLARLLRQGHRVAICEQLSPPGRGLVDRAVVRVVTPGTVADPALLPAKENSYLAALCPGPTGYGLAYVDVMTGEFSVTEFADADAALARVAVENDLLRIGPRECLVPKAESPEDPDPFAAGSPAIPGHTTPYDARFFGLESAADALRLHFGVVSLEAFGCDHLPHAIRAAGAILSYLRESNAMLLPLLTSLRTYRTEGTMHLDAATRRNLELHWTGRGGTAAHTLLGTLDGTKTAMGGRLLRRMLVQPLTDRAAIEERLDAVEAFTTRTALRMQALTLLASIGDMERLTARARQEAASPRELIALRDALRAVPTLVALLHETQSPALDTLAARLDPCTAVADVITRAILPPEGKEDKRRIRPGYDSDFDALVHTATHARETIAAMETAERERTGIRSLKIKHNSVFGYGIEITRPNLSHVPEDYTRSQTLTHAERFFTPVLKEWEATILRADERREARETEIYTGVLREIGVAAPVLLGTARAVAHVDLFAALAECAILHRYVRPTLADDTALRIVAGRHPVVEASLLHQGETFIPNDTTLDTEAHQLILLTGPNMAGKSTYLRQVALVVLMAQIGSFVPAERARVGLVDRIFTRIGAQDDLAAGASTFLVEMMETANILRHATQRSLIVLDEVGRGTGTNDGLAIARAVVEDLVTRVRARTLFATHYHDLAAPEAALPGVCIASAAVAEEDDTITFLHRIQPGAMGKSYGIHVARLAGLPAHVVERATELLLSREYRSEGTQKDAKKEQEEEGERNQTDKGYVRFNRHSPDMTDHPPLSARGIQQSTLLGDLAALDLARMTPLEAINALDRLQGRARDLLDRKIYDALIGGDRPADNG